MLAGLLRCTSAERERKEKETGTGGQWGRSPKRPTRAPCSAPGAPWRRRGTRRRWVHPQGRCGRDPQGQDPQGRGRRRLLGWALIWFLRPLLRLRIEKRLQ